jgi:hypothetical protein
LAGDRIRQATLPDCRQLSVGVRGVRPPGHMQALISLQEIFREPDEAVEVFKAARLAPYAPEDELRHWVLSGLKQRPDGLWNWRLEPAFRVSTPDRSRLVHSTAVMWSLLSTSHLSHSVGAWSGDRRVLDRSRRADGRKHAQRPHCQHPASGPLDSAGQFDRVCPGHPGLHDQPVDAIGRMSQRIVTARSSDAAYSWAGLDFPNSM